MEDTIPYIENVINSSDNNRRSFGFLNSSAYSASAEKGNLWVLVENNEFVGYLLIGGRFPILKVFQIFIDDKFSNMGYASKMLNELKIYAKENHYHSITAKVAAELKANHFWKKNDFTLANQIPGKGENPRIINRYIYDIQSNNLFNSEELGVISSFDDLCSPRSPLLSIPIFCIDLNVLFDYVRKRKNEIDVAQLVSQALSGHIRLYITSEFTEELRRHSVGNDPILRFSEQLSTLPQFSANEYKDDQEKLLKLIFSSKNGLYSQNDISDVNHLLSCIKSGIDGFITSDNSILKQSINIYKQYGLEILSPYELNPDDSSLDLNSIGIESDLSLNIAKIDGFIGDKYNDFFNRISLNAKKRLEISSKKYENIYSITLGNNNIGIIGYKIIPRKISTIECIVLIDENIQNIYQIIDACFNTITRVIDEDICIIHLNINNSAEITIEDVKKRGFLFINRDFDGFSCFEKLQISKIVDNKSWKSITEDIFTTLKFRFPEICPNFDELIHTGIIMESEDKKKFLINLLNFETMFSPVVLLTCNRQSVIIPIRFSYAEKFFPEISIQGNLFPDHQASISTEKVYYRSPKGARKYKIGMIALFYVSGRDGMEVIGHGRITYSNILRTENISEQFTRQGVLDDHELSKISRDGKVHVIAFDNFRLFKSKVSYKFLKDNQLISDANLITSEVISYRNTKKIFNLGYSTK